MKDPVYKFLQIVTFILFSVMSILVFMQVILRYFFSSPIAWSDEMSRLLMIWVSFLGIALAFFTGAHPSITFLVGKFNGKSKEIYEIIVNVILLIAFVGITYYGTVQCFKSHRFASTILRFPMSLQYSALPVCTTFMSYKIIKDFVIMFKEKKKGKEEL